jgi:hypothetical protein
VNVTLKLEPDPDTFEVNLPVMFCVPAKSFALEATAFAPRVTTIDPAVPAVNIGAFGVGMAIIAPKTRENNKYRWNCIQIGELIFAYPKLH